MCGEPGGKWAKMYKDVDTFYNQKIELIDTPCESYFINIRFRTDNIDTNLVKELHQKLYNEKKLEGWKHINIYSKDNIFLFGHLYTGEILNAEAQSK